MTSATDILDDRLNAGLTRLVALSDIGGGGRIAALIRHACGRTLSLPPLPSEIEVAKIESDVESLVVEFAEQFTTDVSVITADQRATLMSRLGERAFRTVVLMYVADFVPRVRAGLEALGTGLMYLSWSDGTVAWDHESDPADAVLNGFLPDVARLRVLDPVTSEVVRLRGASQHNCRLCKSLRESTALDAGGTEPLYAGIEHYETSELLTDRQRAALRYVDALIWSPAQIAPDIVAGVRRYFSDAEAVELTFDVMRNASNKIAVALGADAPRVEHGTERYLLTADGQTQFG
jgi:alkylhydroperoxidase family enzyme